MLPWTAPSTLPRPDSHGVLASWAPRGRGAGPTEFHLPAGSVGNSYVAGQPTRCATPRLLPRQTPKRPHHPPHDHISAHRCLLSNVGANCLLPLQKENSGVINF